MLSEFPYGDRSKGGVLSARVRANVNLVDVFPLKDGRIMTADDADVQVNR